MKKGKRGRPPKQTTSSQVDESLVQGISNISLEKEKNEWSCSTLKETTPGGTEVKNNKFVIHRNQSNNVSKNKEAQKEDDIFEDDLITISKFEEPLITFSKSNETQQNNKNEKKTTEKSQNDKPFLKTYKKALTSDHRSSEMGSTTMNMAVLSSPISAKSTSETQNRGVGVQDGGGGFTPMAKRQSAGPTPEQMRINRIFESSPAMHTSSMNTSSSSSSSLENKDVLERNANNNSQGKKNKKRSSKKGSKNIEPVVLNVESDDNLNAPSSSSSSTTTTTTSNIVNNSTALSIARAGPYSPGPASGFNSSTLFNSFNANNLQDPSVLSSPRTSSPSSTSTSFTSSVNTSMQRSPEVLNDYKLNAVSSLKSPITSDRTSSSSSPSFTTSPFPPSPIVSSSPSPTSNMITSHDQNKTVAMLAPSACIGHDTGEAHQECSERLQVLCSMENGALRRAEFNSELQWFAEPNVSRACEADILRVHEWEYVDHLRRQCCRAELGDGPTLDQGQAVGFFDSDTRLSPGSWDAAQAAVDACLTAVDVVMKDFDRTNPLSPSSEQNHHKAFVAVRPPGHHAGSRGCVNSPRHFWQRPDMCSCGFCLLNNVAVAAAYARYKFGHQGLRVAIVDFDIHHGNGTQEIVENLLPRSRCLPLPSSWNPMEVPSFKPWYQSDLDAKSVFFSSINLEDGAGFYPGDGANHLAQFQVNSQNESLIDSMKQKEDVSGACKSLLKTENAKQQLNDNIVNVTVTPVKGAPLPGDLRARKKQSLKDRNKCCEVASEQFRRGISSELLPKLEKFNPDLVFISAGFDGHKDDFYHYLTEEDYGWLTSELVQLMASRGGRIISVLEGGYSLEPLHQPKQNNTTSSSKPTSKMISRSNSNSKISIPVAVAEPSPLPLNNDGGLVKGMMAHLHALASKN